MSRRKTTAVLTLLNFANTQLQRTDNFATREYKAGICTMIEKVLSESNNYWGFSFINTKDSIECNHPNFYNRTYQYNSTMFDENQKLNEK